MTPIPTAATDSTTAGWPDPIGTMAAPNCNDIQAAHDDITEIQFDPDVYGNYPIRQRLEERLATIFAQIVAIADAPARTIALKYEMVTGIPIYHIDYSDIDTVYPLGLQDPSRGDINADRFLANLTRYAARYRQKIAYQRLAAGEGHSFFFDSNAIKHRIDREHGLGLKPCHPAMILTDYHLVSGDFTQRYDPRIIHGFPNQPWIKEDQRTGTTLKMRLGMPHSVAESLHDYPLHRLIELPEASLAKLPPHALEAWQSCRIDRVSIERLAGEDCDYITLKPTRQICWAPGALPHDHIPTSAAEQALVNLARTGEIL